MKKQEPKEKFPIIKFKPEAEYIIILPLMAKNDEVTTKAGIVLANRQKQDDLERGTVMISGCGVERGAQVVYRRFGSDKLVEDGIDYVIIKEANLIGVYIEKITKKDVV